MAGSAAGLARRQNQEKSKIPARFATVLIRHHGAAMPIPKDLLDILVCPACKAPVKPTPDDSGLKCQACRRVYPVRDDIPVMLIEEAAIAPE
jgi:uncharacterized protein